MSKGSGPWQDGRRAWERLTGWHQDTPTATPGHPDDGDGALTALLDVSLLRHLLDQAELVAVRTARRHGKPWSEIATKLGVTRQSAWERWRDLDDEVAAVDQPHLLRRRSSIVVPNVIGMTWDDARKVLRDKGLLAASPDPDGPPLGALGWPDGVVTDQSPESGAKVPAGSSVRLWIGRGHGGGAGVREPRRPLPGPISAREMRYEPTDEAVG